MNLLIVAATEFEITPFLATNNSAEILITGVGIPSTIFSLANKLSTSTYDLIIQAGIAGTFNDSFDKTDVFLISEDTFADIGIDEKGNFQTLFEKGFAAANEFPYKDGWLKNEHAFTQQNILPVAKAITVNKITNDKNIIARQQEKFKADVESMEGAAFHYVCLMQKVKFLQLRSISNIVGERDKSKWKMKESIAVLNVELDKLIQKFK